MPDACPVCSAQRQKAALADQQVQYQELVTANRLLQEQHEVSLRDNFEVTEFLRREILTKDGKITLLQSKMEEVTWPLGQLTLLQGFCDASEASTIVVERQSSAQCWLTKQSASRLHILLTATANSHTM